MSGQPDDTRKVEPEIPKLTLENYKSVPFEMLLHAAAQQLNLSFKTTPTLKGLRKKVKALLLVDSSSDEDEKQTQNDHEDTSITTSVNNNDENTKDDENDNGLKSIRKLPIIIPDKRTLTTIGLKLSQLKKEISNENDMTEELFLLLDTIRQGLDPQDNQQEESELLQELPKTLTDLSKKDHGNDGVDILKSYLQLFGFSIEMISIDDNDSSHSKNISISKGSNAEIIDMGDIDGDHEYDVENVEDLPKYKVSGELDKLGFEIVNDNFDLIKKAYDAHQKNDLRSLQMQGERVFPQILKSLEIRLEEVSQMTSDDDDLLGIHDTGFFTSKFITFTLQQVEFESRESRLSLV